MDDFGFITLALNRSSYLQLATNLAATIKASDYEARVAVVTNLKGNFSVFDKVIYTESDNAFELKAKLYKLSPFKHTIFIDADSAFIFPKHSIDKIWENVRGIDLSFPVLGLFTKQEPAPLRWIELAPFWKWGKLKEDSIYPALYSGLFYFRKSKAASAFFRKADKLYGGYDCGVGNNPPPDEPFFSMAAAQSELTFGELNGIIYLADKPHCNESEICKHLFITMPGSPTKKHIRFYNAMIIRAGKFGFNTQGFSK